MDPHAMRRAAPVEVRPFGALEELAPFAETLRELNAGGRRPSPFQTLEYLAVHLAHDEHARPATEAVFFAAFEGERLIGLLPMRRRAETILGARRTKLELLATDDADRPAILARAEDEARCAEAFFRHVFESAGRWTMLELREQDAESPLHRPPIDETRYYVRHFPNDASATIDLGEGFEGWFRGLKSFRSNLARRARDLLAAGRVEFIASADRRAARPFLDLYLDLESRSWKAATTAGIARHPARIEKFRAMLGPEQPSTPLFHWLLLDGVPIAGMLSLCFAGVAYQMELAFDGAYSDLSPGNVMFMLAARDAATRGAKAYNVRGDFARHTSRWNAVVTETHAVQIYRRSSLHHQRALAGEWARRVLGRRVTRAGVAWLDDLDEAPPVRENRSGARDRAAAMLGALRRAGVDMQRLDEQALRAVLPFAVMPGRTTASSAA